MLALESSTVADDQDVRDIESVVTGLLMLTVDICSEVGVVYALIYRLKLHAFVIDQIINSAALPARILKYLIDVL